MASTILRLDDKRSRAFHALGFLSLMLLMQNCAARQFQVSWSVPSNNSTLNQWAEKNRFQTGDSLVFKYSSGQDSVLEVTKDAYDNCSTEVPLAKFTDGHTVFTFNHSGPFYFISGSKDNCLKSEKLIVVVLADRSNSSSKTNDTTPPSPSPSNSTDMITPAPAPADENSPPAGPVDINPTPAPEAPPSTASSTFISLINSIGALAAASSLLLAF
ncbi:early nodulin-like protein 1 isoform X2 [Pistacia vera]|uniref:early nodulin-like protein 1 isoform X1 n=1 Tax=Pistacia vera TaxID=55513 RepID=UPI001262DA33|nr:early nodulin-like protein 1 isoform X1 [Pistacia vera]XP_031261997.1 early nodulin-like protein 1 isoform X2 [Pistacia vera]